LTEYNDYIVQWLLNNGIKYSWASWAVGTPHVSKKIRCWRGQCNTSKTKDRLNNSQDASVITASTHETCAIKSRKLFKCLYFNSFQWFFLLWCDL